MARRGGTRQSTAQRQNQTSKARALSFLLLSIRDPRNPLHCGTCIDGAFIECTNEEREAFEDKDWPNLKSTKKPKCDPEVWNAIVRFMFHKRTDEEMQTLLDRMAECRCHSNGQFVATERYHEIALWNMEREQYDLKLACNKDEATHPEHRILTSARCGWVFDIFMNLSSAILGIKRKAATASANNWPTNLMDLFPFGPDGFIQSILQWYHHIHDPVVFHFMIFVIKISQTLVIPSLMKYQVTETIVHSMREMLDRGMLDILDLNDPHTILLSRNRFFFHVGCTLSYFEAAASPDCRAALLRGSETKIVQLCSVIIYLSDEWERISGVPSNEGIDIEKCTLLGQTTYRLFHMHRSLPSPLPVHPLLVEMDTRIFLDSMQREPPENGFILLAIRRFRWDLECSAHGCTNSLQSAGQNFQRCGGCSVVSYCSRQCQVNAWKRESYPHRRVCAALKNLVEKGGGYPFFFSGNKKYISDPINAYIFTHILEHWKTEMVEPDLSLVEDWARTIDESKGYPLPNGTDWSPGYEDYDDLIARFSENGKGLKPKYFNCTARWPIDIETDKSLLKLQPFFKQEV